MQDGGGVPARSGREKAYDYLKGSVLTDPEMQGRFLSEQEIADQISVSRTPIREALLLLAAEDLVRLVPKRGAYIAPLSGREITELMELRGLFERYAAEQLLKRDAVPVEELTRILEQQRELLEPDQAQEFIKADHRFHATLVAAINNDLLTQLYDGLRSRQIRAGVIALYRVANRRAAVLAEHQAIVDALAAGKAEQASDTITRHLTATLQVLLAG